MSEIIQNFPASLQRQWQKEFAESFTSSEALLSFLEISNKDAQQDQQAESLFSLRVPKPFADRMQKGNIHDPLLQQVLPLRAEFIVADGYSNDPLEEQSTPISGMLHKYTSRILLIFRASCAINCRYCFRRHFPYKDNHFGTKQKQEILSYIAKKPAINEVILSGGDPLMAPDHQIEAFIHSLENIEHISTIRIHTRLPVVIPSRITDELLAIFRTTRLNVVFVTHINHPNEIDAALSAALQKLKPHCNLLANQTVLLRNINDNKDTLVELSQQLFNHGVLPYYLHVLDKVSGAMHFDMPEAEAIKLYKQLQASISGYLVPKLVREVGGEMSKTLINV